MKFYTFVPVVFKKIWGQEIGLLSGNNIVNSIAYRKNNEEITTLKAIMKQEDFPLIIKIITPIKDLSIQVHPNDTYAQKEEKCLGKDEFWYILNDAQNMKIINGHKAPNRAEFLRYLNSNKLESILNCISVKRNDCVQITAGTVHSLKKDVKVLEIQENSDITYRIFDYKRMYNGAYRKLDLYHGLEAIVYPSIHKNIIRGPFFNTCKKKVLEKNKHYTIIYYNLSQTYNQVLELKFFSVFYILEGSGYFEDTRVEKGMCFLITPTEQKCKISGKDLKFLLIYV